jgi:hypothetical protein
MLYIVPPKVDDDWYWMYISLMSNYRANAINTSSASNIAPNSSQIYQTQSLHGPFVITNDLTRDHKSVFDQPRSFIRWRSTQVYKCTIRRYIDMIIVIIC